MPKRYAPGFRRAVCERLIAGEQFCYRWDGNAIAHDSSFALGQDRLTRSEMAQSLRDSGFGEAGSGGEIGNADRPRGVDTAEQAQPGGVGQ